MRLLICILGCILLFSCSSDAVPNDVIKPDQMKLVVWDMMLADQLAAQNTSSDSSLNVKAEYFKLYDQVFAIHKTTREQYFKSYKYYQEHPTLYKSLMKDVKLIAEKENKGALKKGR